MALKYIIAKLEDVAEPLRGMYKAEGDKFVLDVDGAVDKSKVDEFRTNNIALQQQLEKLKDIDPVKYAELKKLDQQVKEGELIKAGKLEEVVNLRVGEMKQTYETQLNTTNLSLQQANQQLSLLLIDNAVKNEAIKNGVVPTAVDDVVLRARGVYVVDKGVPVPKDSNGNIIYGKDGTTPKPMSDWLVDLKKTAPHLFAGSRGSGADGGRGFGGMDPSKMSAVEKINAGLNQGGLMNLPPEPKA